MENILFVCLILNLRKESCGNWPVGGCRIILLISFYVPEINHIIKFIILMFIVQQKSFEVTRMIG